MSNAGVRRVLTGIAAGLLLACLPAASSRVVTLSWVAPTRNADGTRLTELAGYRVYFGQNSAHLDQMISVRASVNQYTLADLANGTWYFAVSAYDADGAESRLIGPVSRIVD